MNTGRRVVLVVLRVVVGLVFGYAGWIKFQAPQAFADSIATFQLLPRWLISLLALGLPPYEIVVGVLLLSGWKPRIAAFCGLMACALFLFRFGFRLGPRLASGMRLFRWDAFRAASSPTAMAGYRARWAVTQRAVDGLFQRASPGTSPITASKKPDASPAAGVWLPERRFSWGESFCHAA